MHHVDSPFTRFRMRHPHRMHYVIPRVAGLDNNREWGSKATEKTHARVAREEKRPHRRSPTTWRSRQVPPPSCVYLCGACTDGGKPSGKVRTLPFRRGGIDD
eukprot:scaffold1800_cov332-Pavlova_lutheri.AAC.5